MLEAQPELIGERSWVQTPLFNSLLYGSDEMVRYILPRVTESSGALCS